MEHTTLTLTILRGITVLIGLVFLYFTGRSYLRHRQSNLLVLFIAIGLLILGAIVEGAAVQVFDAPLSLAHVLEAAIGLVAFSVLLFSVLYRPKRSAPASQEPPRDSRP